jgi:indolepyruvate ferredoxin oxidoreductase
VRYARRYGEDLARVAALELEHGNGDGMPISSAYARGLFKLMAYKDEYEVARLHLDGMERARLQAEFGNDATAKVLLHPPLLRALGLKRKLAFGRSARIVFAGLRAARHVRGTRLDPFGYAKVRGVERALIDEYRGHVSQALQHLDGSNAALVAEVADLPDMVRGYEEIKLRSVELMRSRAQVLLGHLATPEGETS